MYLSLYILGAHAPEGYSNHFVWLSVSYTL